CRPGDRENGEAGVSSGEVVSERPTLRHLGSHAHHRAATDGRRTRTPVFRRSAATPLSRRRPGRPHHGRYRHEGARPEAGPARSATPPPPPPPPLTAPGTPPGTRGLLTPRPGPGAVAGTRGAHPTRPCCTCTHGRSQRRTSGAHGRWRA